MVTQHEKEKGRELLEVKGNKYKHTQIHACTYTFAYINIHSYIHTYIQEGTLAKTNDDNESMINSILYISIQRKILILLVFFFFVCFGSSLLLVGFLQLRGVGVHSSLQSSGLSLRWPLLMRSAGFSSCGSRALERRLSSCGSRAQLLCGMWDLPRLGLEPTSPALAGGLPTTAPPGKPFLVV